MRWQENERRRPANLRLGNRTERIEGASQICRRAKKAIVTSKCRRPASPTKRNRQCQNLSRCDYKSIWLQSISGPWEKSGKICMESVRIISRLHARTHTPTTTTHICRISLLPLVFSLFSSIAAKLNAPTRDLNRALLSLLVPSCIEMGLVVPLALPLPKAATANPLAPIKRPRKEGKGREIARSGNSSNH